MRYVQITSESEALKAVERNGDALQYVKDFDLFVKLAEKFGITVEG